MLECPTILYYGSKKQKAPFLFQNSCSFFVFISMISNHTNDGGFQTSAGRAWFLVGLVYSTVIMFVFVVVPLLVQLCVLLALRCRCRCSRRMNVLPTNHHPNNNVVCTPAVSVLSNPTGITAIHVSNHMRDTRRCKFICMMLFVLGMLLCIVLNALNSIQMETNRIAILSIVLIVIITFIAPLFDAFVHQNTIVWLVDTHNRTVTLWVRLWLLRDFVRSDIRLLCRHRYCTVKTIQLDQMHPTIIDTSIHNGMHRVKASYMFESFNKMMEEREIQLLHPDLDWTDSMQFKHTLNHQDAKLLSETWNKLIGVAVDTTGKSSSTDTTDCEQSLSSVGDTPTVCSASTHVQTTTESFPDDVVETIPTRIHEPLLPTWQQLDSDVLNDIQARLVKLEHVVLVHPPPSAPPAYYLDDTM